ncbi:hypothetical protein [Inconstantimicrobium mannanitabidum]|uniref:Uncharacterized protein n=1 Tax=Inconstantimicrobium mannanitabidum TaxID=1604901 RepID=A0ACB5R8V2_9CLOT|nr:hypothetical protein [Clostridium sp. TW13]GKX65610.1 hypothetical protein rsdtw13_08680 [Clostridium sp. TW13]
MLEIIKQNLNEELRKAYPSKSMEDVEKYGKYLREKALFAYRVSFLVDRVIRRAK